MSAVSPKPSSKPLYLPNMQVRFAYKNFKDATAAAYLLVSVILQLINQQYKVSMETVYTQIEQFYVFVESTKTFQSAIFRYTALQLCIPIGNEAHDLVVTGNQ